MKDKVLTLKVFLLSKEKKISLVSILTTNTKSQLDHLVDSLVDIRNSIPF